MAKVTVTRTRQFTERHRLYQILVDGKRVGSIGNGKTIETELEPGTHDIRARIGWFGSQRLGFEVEAERHQHFAVSHASIGRPLAAIGLTLLVWQVVAWAIWFVILPFCADEAVLPLVGLAASPLTPCLLVIGLVIAWARRWRDRYLRLKPIPVVDVPAPESKLGMRWRPRLSVRGLMVVILVIGTPFGLIHQLALVQREVVRAIENAGGAVRYYGEQQPIFHHSGIPTPATQPTWWDSLTARIVPYFFRPVVAVGFTRSPIYPTDDLMAQIGRLSGLEELDFDPFPPSQGFGSYSTVTAAGLAHLRRLPRLQRLNLGRTGATGKGLAQLRGMTQLRWLDLRELSLKDDDLINLEGLTSLEALMLSSNGITDQGLAHLAGLTNLNYLVVSSPWVTSAGLHHLSGMTRLTSLELDSPRIDSLRSLKSLNRLWMVTLRDTSIGDEDLAIIARSKGLKYLNVSHTRVDDAGLAHLAGLSSLVTLDLPKNRITDKGLVYFTGLPKWTPLQLDLDGTGVTNGGVAALSTKRPVSHITHDGTVYREPCLTELRKLREPKELKITNLFLRDDDLINLRAFASLEKLLLRSDGISDAGLAHLSGLTNLKSLSLDSRSITSAGLGHLRGMKQLQELTLDSPKIDRLHDLENLDQLETLHLDDTAVEDEDMATVAGFKRLNTLTLCNTKIGDAGLAYLAALKELNRLVLRGTRITDSGLGSLVDLAHCQYLGVERTAVTPYGAGLLLARFPKLRIVQEQEGNNPMAILMWKMTGSVSSAPKGPSPRATGGPAPGTGIEARPLVEASAGGPDRRQPASAPALPR